MQLIRKVYKAFITRLPVILIINVAMLFILGTLYLILGGNSFSTYVKEMALNIMSVKDAFIYVSILAIYGFTIEFLFRKIIQDRFLTSDVKWIKSLAFILPVALYVLVHSRYGKIGIIYSFLTGTFLTVFYLWKKDWLTYSLWHMLWGFVIIPLSMIACVFLGGQIRNDFLYAYKKRHIIKQKMYYVQDWGWVDYTHYRPEHFEIVKKAIDKTSGKGTTIIHDGWTTPLRIRVDFHVKYTFTKQNDPMKDWAIATGMMMHFMRANEEVQEGSPWYHGNQLSAWQFDDMSSCLLCCLDHLPNKQFFSREKGVHESEKLLEIWEKTGEELVGVKMQEDNSWALVKSSKKDELRKLVDDMKQYWTAQEVVMTKPEGH